METAELLVDRDGAAQLTMTAAGPRAQDPRPFVVLARCEPRGAAQPRADSGAGGARIRPSRAAMGRSGADGVRALASALAPSQRVTRDGTTSP